VKPDSRAVHAGRELRARDPLAPPIDQTSVYVYEDLDDYDAVAAGRIEGHVYARNSNRSVAMLEAAVAELEGGEDGVAAASGMAALVAAVLGLAPAPVRILAPHDLYGVTTALLRQDLVPFGYSLEQVSLGDLDAVARALDGAGLVLCETISNPLCAVYDLEAVCRLAAARGVPVVVDNTFATPVLCRPLELGASLVAHSATKYLGGHSDLVAGVVAGSAEAVHAVRSKATRLGATLGPFEAWLALRGIRTLALRVRRQSASALRLAESLLSMPGVAAVHYPLLEGSPYEPVARRLLPEGAGGMLAFDLSEGREAVQRMLGRLRMVSFAASLGGVETTVSHPEITSHRTLTASERAQLGISPGTVRVSTGIEDPEDVAADFRQALEG
jgi:cystathionine beta-lyase/cystathionine gamma-synthase